MIAAVTLLILGLFFYLVVMGIVGIAATPTPPTKTQAAARLEEAPRVLDEVFDGRINTAFTRQLWEPITEEMLLHTANQYGYRFVSKDNAAGNITYHFSAL